MLRLAWLRCALIGGATLLAGAARAQDGGTGGLSGSDFTFTLVADGNELSADEARVYFSRARCACPTNVTAKLTLADDAAATLSSTDTLTVDFRLGNDCDVVDAPGCASTSLGNTMLSMSDHDKGTGISTAAVFSAAGDATCTSTTSTELWAIVRLNGSRLASHPQLQVTVGGDGPAAPTKVATVSAENGLLVTWTPPGDTTTLHGYQVLCSPGPMPAKTAAYDNSCAAAAPPGTGGPFDGLPAALVCSGLIGVGTNSVRVQSLTNGTAYQVAVVAVGIDGTPSAPSEPAEGTPAETVGFGDLYKEAGGTAAGCAVAGASPRRIAIGASIAVGLLLGWAWRRRRGGALIAILVFAVAGARPAGATADDILAPPPPPRPGGWNVELRFGPYRPDVDSEFANRGDSARPFAQIFSSSRHLMSQLEIDRHFSHHGGTWAAGIAFGYYNVTAAALSADLQSRSGDNTGLRLIPLSAALIYRADTLRRRLGSPLVPYAKAGLDCTLWKISDTSQPDINGRTVGWHAAAGVSVDLSPLDPQAAEDLRRESGVDQIALFAEGALYRLDGFGSGSALHVGDATWFAGLMLEM